MMIAPAKAISCTGGFDRGAGGALPLRVGGLGGQRLALLLMQITLVLGVASVVLVVAPRLRDPLGDVVTYAAWGGAMLAGGVAALRHGKLAEERMKQRWILLGVSLCGGALDYLIASANNFAAVFHVLDPLMIVAGTVGSAAMLLSITISFNGAPVGIVVLDLAQTALYISLSYVVNAGSNPWAKDVQSHVVISLLVNLMLFLTAAVAPLSATTKEERRFFRIVAIYLGAAWVGRFLSSQVGYLWMHAHGNLYDLPSIGVCLAMALFLMQSAWIAAQTSKPDRELAKRRLMLRNLMPSFLAFTSLLIALYVFLHSPLAGLLPVLCAVLLYVSRTLLLQTHMGRETTALRHRNEQLEEISQMDPLTGAGNRRSLSARYLRCMDDPQASVALLLIDLDFFKQANDLLGHLQGDYILQKIADVLHSASSSVAGSHVARFGGDEFAMLLPRVHAAGAAELAETVRAGVELLEICAGDFAVSVSIGGVATQAEESLDALIRRADIALYRAKSRGRNRAEFDFDEKTMEEKTAELTLVAVA